MGMVYTPWRQVYLFMSVSVMFAWHTLVHRLGNKKKEKKVHL